MLPVVVATLSFQLPAAVHVRPVAVATELLAVAMKANEADDDQDNKPSLRVFYSDDVDPDPNTSCWIDEETGKYICSHDLDLWDPDETHDDGY